MTCVLARARMMRFGVAGGQLVYHCGSKSPQYFAMRSARVAYVTHMFIFCWCFHVSEYVGVYWRAKNIHAFFFSWVLRGGAPVLDCRAYR